MDPFYPKWNHLEHKQGNVASNQTHSFLSYSTQFENMVNFLQNTQERHLKPFSLTWINLNISMDK